MRTTDFEVPMVIASRVKSKADEHGAVSISEQDQKSAESEFHFCVEYLNF
jgi:hypothetical protein